MDEVYDMDFERTVHPCHRREGAVRALETIRFAISTHRGCYGECNFCAITVHEGRTVSSRSEESILREAAVIASLPGFKGYILDVGGPTANMYGFECKKKLARGACPDRRCLYPKVCENLHPDHGPQLALLVRLRAVPGVKQAIVASGIRYDLLLADRKHGVPYLRAVVRRHVSGLMKIAPEHSEAGVLRCMGKPGTESLLIFQDLFRKLTAQAHKEQFLSYYLVAAHPGCTQADMEALRRFAARELTLRPEQVQLFTPVPATLSTLMYCTERNPLTGGKLFVEKTAAGRELQKQILVEKNSPFGYGKSTDHQTTKGGEPWAKIRTSRKKPRKNLPKR